MSLLIAGLFLVSVETDDGAVRLLDWLLS